MWKLHLSNIIDNDYIEDQLRKEDMVMAYQVGFSEKDNKNKEFSQYIGNICDNMNCIEAFHYMG